MAHVSRARLKKRLMNVFSLSIQNLVNYVALPGHMKAMIGRFISGCDAAKLIGKPEHQDYSFDNALFFLLF